MLMINLLFIYILYNFIFSKKSKKNTISLIFILSIFIFSIGIGLTIISIKDFNYINDINNDYYVTTEKITNMKDNLYFDNVFSDQFKFEETNSNDIKIVCKHSKYHKCNINIYDNDVVIYTYQNETNIMEQVREYINIINKKEIINYYNQEIIVYTSKENIDKLIENRKNYIQDINENAMQEEINRLYDSLNEKNIKISELEDKIYELENYIY